MIGIPPSSKGIACMAVSVVFLSLTTITITLRLYCRAFVVRSLALDDWFVVLAWVFFLPYATIGAIIVYHGAGHRFAVIHPTSEIPTALLWWWICELLYVVVSTSIKVSIGILLLRLAIDQHHRFIVQANLVVMVLLNAVFSLCFILQCHPTKYFWTRFTGGTGSCYNPRILVAMAYLYSALVCICDWIYAILPILLVWNLQMNPRTKSVVSMILAMGMMASLATIIRIPYMHTLADHEFLEATLDIIVCSVSEVGLGITAANIATLRPLFKSFLGRDNTTSTSSTSVTFYTPSGSGFKNASNGKRSGLKSFTIDAFRPGINSWEAISRQNDIENVHSIDFENTPQKRSSNNR